MRFLLINILFIAFFTTLQGQDSPTITSNTFIQQEYNKSDIFDEKLGAIRDFNVLDNKDTLLIYKVNGDWWFGVFAGPNLTLLTGNVRWAQYPLDLEPGTRPVTDDPGNPLVDYTPTRISGRGFTTGLLVEWKPPKQKWGLAFRIFPLEQVNLEARTGVPEEERKFDGEEYIFSSNMNYFGISPQYSYKIDYLDLKTFAGIDMFFRIGHSSQVELSNEPGNSNVIIPQIINELDNSFTDITRFGLNVGVEYEYLVQGIGKNRIRFAPYLMANYTTSYVSDFGSSVSPIILRAGLTVKIGPDKTILDTIPYNPNQFREDLLASLSYEPQVKFDGFLERELLVSAELSYIKPREVFEQVSEEPQLPQQGDLVDSRVGASLEEEEEVEELKLTKGQVITYQYKEGATVPDAALKEYLDKMIEQMKKNPNLEIRVTAHTGSLMAEDEAQKLSEQRAERVLKYMVLKGIPKRRVLVRGLGGREAIENFRTKAGRDKNRRIEIEIMNL